MNTDKLVYVERVVQEMERRVGQPTIQRILAIIHRGHARPEEQPGFGYFDLSRTMIGYCQITQQPLISCYHSERAPAFMINSSSSRSSQHAAFRANTDTGSRLWDVIVDLPRKSCLTPREESAIRFDIEQLNFQRVDRQDRHNFARHVHIDMVEDIIERLHFLFRPYYVMTAQMSVINDVMSL